MLSDYRAKRKFSETPEPPPTPAPAAADNTFVVQKHDATRLHYDLRLEINGVLASWAVPKGPSLNPADKRLAVQTEDHPLDYANFEGVIPEGNYGAGPVMVWDRGTYEVEGKLPAAEQLARGEIKFVLHGHKLHGSFALVHTGKRGADPKERQNWLVIKHKDEFVDPGWDMEKLDWSVLSGRSIREIEAGAPAQASNPGELPGARASAMPHAAEPMLATLIEQPFSSPDWLFELKWDGMRVLSWVRDSKVLLRSRRGRTVTSQFPELAAVPERVAAREAILDGEAVVLDSEGRSDFGMMQQRMNVDRPAAALLSSAPVVYYVFDLLYCDGYDLRGVPLLERKRLLKRILIPEPPVRFSGHVVGEGEELFRLAKERGLEGIIGKRLDSRYTGTRTPQWVKLKTTCEVDAVIGGFTAPRGSRERFGALILGLYDEGRLRFIGCAGTGFNDKSAAAVWAELEKRVVKQRPFREDPLTREKPTWVKPEVVARVKYTNWTHEHHLRAPVFLGLRLDVDSRECVWEGAGVVRPAPEDQSSPVLDAICNARGASLTLQVDGRELKFTNLNKVYFPEPGLTKRDLLCWYARVAEYILPFLRERPLVLRRMPEGLKGEMFYQKDAGEYAAAWMPTVTIPTDVDGVRRDVRYFLCNDRAALLYLTNLGCIDHNTWASRIDDLERPDYVFIDLDPTDETPFSTVVDVARAVHDVLNEIGMRVFLKTSGATGFHIFVPIERVYEYNQATAFGEIISRLAAARVPDKVTFERIVRKRPRGRVLMDYLQLAYSRSLASVYSVRPVPAASISAPVRPDELRPALDPGRFTIRTMPARLAVVGDLWKDFWTSRQRLEPALDRLKARSSPQRRRGDAEISQRKQN